MAARKKAQAKRRKAPARKPAARRKKARPGAKPARKARPRRAAPPARKPARAKPAAVPARPATPAGERIGIVTHYFGHLSVAVLKLDPGARLRVGDTIRIQGHTSDFSQRIDSLQVDHAPVMEVGPQDDFGVKVREHAREHDVVYKIA